MAATKTETRHAAGIDYTLTRRRVRNINLRVRADGSVAGQRVAPGARRGGGRLCGGPAALGAFRPAQDGPPGPVGCGRRRGAAHQGRRPLPR